MHRGSLAPKAGAPKNPAAWDPSNPSIGGEQWEDTWEPEKPKKDDKQTTVFVGGLRKTTCEDKVIAHFSKFGQVDSVDIKHLPDGTSRGFAFVKFADMKSVDKVIEAQSSHMIDNKWVAVRPHGGSEFTAQNNAEKDQVAKASAAREEHAKVMDQSSTANSEQEWSEKYLSAAAQIAAMQGDESGGNAQAANPMAGMMNQMGGMMGNPMMNPMMGMMGNAMGGGGAGMGANPMAGGANGGMNPMMQMMNPMMMQQMMNPMMMMQMMQMMQACKKTSSSSGGGDDSNDQNGDHGAQRESRSGDHRSAPY